jgi:V8-like Glu-specific endopeptidase
MTKPFGILQKSAPWIACALLTSCGVEQTSAPKMIIGSNDWTTTVDTTDAFPYNGTVVQLGNGCTADYISAQFLLTAAHCVALNQTYTLSNRYSGQQTARVWARGDFESSVLNDWAILVANEPVGWSVGAAALDYEPIAANQGTTVVGYPATLSSILAQSSGTIREITDDGVRYGHDADIVGGHSGSSMGRLSGGTFRVNGIQSWHFWPDATAGSTQTCSAFASGSCSNHAVAIKQFRLAASEGRALESIAAVADFNNDGKKEFLVRDANGISVMRVDDAGAMNQLSRLSNGSRYGGWLLGAQDQVLMVRDFNSNGRAEIFLRSGWGVGLVEMQADGSWTSLALYPYGTRIGGWLLGANDRIVGAGDFTSDGRQAWVVQSPWGIGLMRLNGSSFENLSLFSYGTALTGGWILSADDVVQGSVPMTYGQDRILIRNSNAIATLYFDSTNGYKPRVAALMNHGGRFPGGWLYNKNDVVVTVGGDTNNDGYGEFIIRSAWGYGVVDASMQTIALQAFGTRAPGGWLLGSDDQILGFTSAGGSSGQGVAVQSAWGVGFLRPASGGFTTAYLAPYGTRFEGGWLLGRRDRVAAMGHVVSSFQDEILIRSGWGFGVLRWDQGSSTLKTHGLWPYATTIGSHTLSSSSSIPAR